MYESNLHQREANLKNQAIESHQFSGIFDLQIANYNTNMVISYGSPNAPICSLQLKLRRQKFLINLIHSGKFVEKV